MDLHKKLALVTLEVPLLDWMTKWGDDNPALADDVATLLYRIDTERRDAEIKESVEIELSKLRHPSQRGRGQQ